MKKTDMILIQDKICDINKSLLEYQKHCNIAKKKYNSDPELYLPMILKLTKSKLSVIKILNKLSEKFDFSYVRDFIFNEKFKYDFYCILFYKGNLLQFVIQFDRKDESDINVLIEQYYLFQMNVHLLRLNGKSNIFSEIKGFWKEITKGHTYVIRNGFAVKKKMSGVDNSLLALYRGYKEKHLVYLKNWKMGLYEDDLEGLDYSDSEERDDVMNAAINNPMNDLNYCERLCDNGYAVWNDVLGKILRKGVFFTG